MAASGAAIDTYAEWLRTVGEPAVPRSGVLWVVRIVLLAALVIHVTAIIQLHARNRAARPAGHRAPRIQRSLSSRTMLVGGLFLLAFIVFHILQFTTGTIEPSEFAEGAVYRNLYEAFQNPLFVSIYVGAAIGARLSPPSRDLEHDPDRRLGQAEPQPHVPAQFDLHRVAVAVGFASVPIAFWTGILEAPP